MTKRFRSWDQLTYEEKLAKEMQESSLEKRRLKDFAKGSMAPRREEKADFIGLPDLFYAPQESMLDEVTLEDLVEPDQLAEMERDDKKWVLRQRIKELENEIRANEERIERYRLQLSASSAPS